MPLDAIKEEKEQLTLQQILPVCGIREDEVLDLVIDTNERTTTLSIYRGEITKLLSQDILSSRVSLIKPSLDGKHLTITIKTY